MAEHTSRPVRIALIQQAGLSSDPEVNKAELRAVIARLAADADFVMATELSTTPYFGAVRDESLRRWSEKLDGPFLSEIGEIAARAGATILTPVYLDRADGSFANAVVVFGPDGRMIEGHTPGREPVPYFTKVHLPFAWRNGKGLDEPFYFHAGDCFPVFDTPKAKIGILVCYDRRFPEAWRSLALAGAELVFMPSCVPAWSPSVLASTADMFVSELQTRACENGFFVAACNRVGSQTLNGVDTQFIGRSCVIDPAGGVIAETRDPGATTLTVQIDLDDVRRIRRRLTLLQDRQPGAYTLDVPAPAVHRGEPRA